MRFLRKVVALVLLGPVVDQRHLGLFCVHHLFHIHRAHHAKLRQILRLAVHIGAAVYQQHALALRRRQYRGQRRAQNAGNAFYNQRSARQNGARAARADKSVPFAVRQRAQRLYHAAVLFPAHRHHRRFVVVNHFPRVHHGQAAGVILRLVQNRLNLLLFAKQRQPQIQQIVDRRNAAFHNRPGRIVAAHGIYHQMNHLSTSFSAYR